MKYFATGGQGETVKVTRLPFTLPHKEISFGKNNMSITSYYHIASPNISPFTCFSDYDTILFNNLNDPVTCESYQGLYIIPHNWTALHLLAICNPPKILEVPPYSEFKTSFLVDKYRKTPLHYLLAHKRINYKAATVIFKYIIDFLEDKSVRTPLVSAEVTDSISDILPFLIVRMSPKLVSQYLRVCWISTPTPYQTPPPEFGFPRHNYICSSSLVSNVSTLSKMIEEDQQQVSFKTIMLKLNYDVASDDIFNYVSHLVYIKDEELFRCPSTAHLINYLWYKTYWLTTFMGILYSVFVILISVCVGLKGRNLPLEIIIIVLSSFFLVCELI